MSSKRPFATLATLAVGTIAGAGLLLTPVTARADNHDTAKPADAGDAKCSGEKKCSGDAKCSGDKKCSGDSKCSGEKDASGDAKCGASKCGGEKK